MGIAIPFIPFKYKSIANGPKSSVSTQKWVNFDFLFFLGGGGIYM